MNENASALGKLAKGKPKTLTPEQRKASADRMRAAQKLRWKDKARQEWWNRLAMRRLGIG